MAFHDSERRVKQTYANGDRFRRTFETWKNNMRKELAKSRRKNGFGLTNLICTQTLKTDFGPWALKRQHRFKARPFLML